MRCPGIIEQAFDKEISIKDAWLHDQHKKQFFMLKIKKK